MVSETFLRKKNELFKQLKRGEILTPQLERAIIDAYSGRGKRALEAIKHHCVIRRGRRWFVRGKSDEYEVFRTFCTCRDYVLSISTEKVDADMCYHALSKAVCELLDRYYVIESEER